VDGVLADFTGALCNELHLEGHGTWCDEDLTTWELTSCFPKKSHAAIERIMTRPGFYSSIPRYPGAQVFLKELRKRGDVSAVTTVVGRAAQERYDWLCSLGFQDHEIVIVEKHETKASVMGDAIIDDRIETLEKCNHYVRIVFDRPWNQKKVPGIARAKDYEKVLAHLDTAFELTSGSATMSKLP
jgi:5'(3')-deoxyribonucleotidase